MRNRCVAAILLCATAARGMQVLIRPGAEASAPPPNAAVDATAAVTPATPIANPPASTCGLMILTAIFTTLRNPHDARHVAADGTWDISLVQTNPNSVLQTFSLSSASHSVKELSQSALNAGVNVTVIYDELPPSMLEFERPGFHFHQVDTKQFDSRHNAPHNARFFFFEQLMEEHPEWQNAFIVDAFDVKVGKNVCAAVTTDKLYLGSELQNKLDCGWMRNRFAELGGKYWEWYRKMPADTVLLNSGIVGGNRRILMQFLTNMTDLLSDRQIAKPWGTVVSDMPAVNYVAYKSFRNLFQTGSPIHSVFRKFENDRKDVWFIHK
eukprot:gnl/TRDRNA2_/TRDRNA2_183483_c0_seq1.p1 gnl/TRDRNA2_/TRDRNA2_183483_c0~~gnl/TRDRNA2_/TRDRNA2_183483_c0_seq1.p1  ORF type:complete len:324 (-),score=55.31 gnl/TRDRNA2_/TRDRNA2_183483_c0_seq1:100-1071(-)